jgi:hypothetical protein
MSARVNVFTEPDLVALLRDEPELLAVADAIASTRLVQRRRRAWPIAFAVAATMALALAAVSVWDGGRASLVDRALAAVGEGPVVHAVMRAPTDNVYVDLQTGGRTPQQIETEIWFDQERKIEHSIRRVEGQLVDEALLSPESDTGPNPTVYSCAWITAHPVEAKKAGVSCDPKDAHLDFTPQLDPALANFVDGYRAALEDGRAKEIGKGELEGRRVTWLALELPGGTTEEIAIEDETGQALQLRRDDHTFDVVVLEAVARAEDDFRVRERRAEPVSGTAGAVGPIPLAEAPEWVPGALWPGPTVRGLRLSEIELQFPTTGFGTDSGRPVERGVGIQLRYGERTEIRIEQSSAPQAAYAWNRFVYHAAPPEGTVLLGFFGGWLVKNGVYVRIWNPNPDVVLEVARALKPIEG